MKNQAILAIVIPAFRSKFLKESLSSIARQSDQRFTVYVGNDNSPEDLFSVCQQFQNEIHIEYTKYDSNLGGKSLSNHWDRCVRLSKEPWIWLFSDDDVMGVQCVEKFYETLHRTQMEYDLYRFNLEIIDAYGGVLRTPDPHPEMETGSEFILRRLKGGCYSTACEYIFSRKVFDRENGFVDFPLAWCSDDATWKKFSERTGIYTIVGPKVAWRFSGNSISSSGRRYAADKVRASISYLRWIREDKALSAYLDQEVGGVSRLFSRWFFGQIRRLRSRLSISESHQFAKEVAQVLQATTYRVFIEFFIHGVFLPSTLGLIYLRGLAKWGAVFRRISLLRQ